MDPANGYFAVVMDGDDGIFILKIDLVTGDYKITLKQTLYKNQGLSIRHISPINSSYLLIIAERKHTMTKSYKIEQENLRGKQQEASGSSERVPIYSLKYNIKKKFETVIIRHSLVNS